MCALIHAGLTNSVGIFKVAQRAGAPLTNWDGLSVQRRVAGCAGDLVACQARVVAAVSLLHVVEPLQLIAGASIIDQRIVDPVIGCFALGTLKRVVHTRLARIMALSALFVDRIIKISGLAQTVVSCGI